MNVYQVSTNTQLVGTWEVMLSAFWVGALRKARTTGLWPTHGTDSGVTMVTSRSSEARTTATLNHMSMLELLNHNNLTVLKRLECIWIVNYLNCDYDVLKTFY